MGKFEHDLKIAEIGEEKTIDFFKSRNVYRIEDVRGDEFWREHDVDFIITENDGNIYKIETKTDTLAHKTRQYCI